MNPNAPHRRLFSAAAIITVALLALDTFAQATDPLPSWNDTSTKKSILDFVTRVTQQGGAEYVAPEDRLATFDNDGTLWSEQPFYTQIFFTLDRVKVLSATHPDWKEEMPFKAALEGDMKSLFAGGDESLVKLVMATHAGMTSDEFDVIVRDWIATARHPKYRRPFTELVYQPMLELLTYLRANGFVVYIVSGGGVEFMRPWAQRVYGVPPEHVIGSTLKVKYELREGKPVIVRLPELDSIDDKEGKPTSIQKFIGKRPIAAFGNSDGDLQMLQWTVSGPGARLAMLIHHTDGARETAYDRESKIGKLDKALDEAKKEKWQVVNMKDDWKYVFPFELPAPRALEISQRWGGDLALSSLAEFPESQRECATGCLRDAAELEAVWKRFKPNESVPAVDFTKNLVVFARNTQYYNTIYIAAVKWTDGLAEVVTSTTRTAAPLVDKVSVMLAVIPRERIQHISCEDRKHPIVK